MSKAQSPTELGKLQLSEPPEGAPLALAVLGSVSLSSFQGALEVERLQEALGPVSMAIVLDAVTGEDVDRALDLGLRGLISSQDDPQIVMATLQFILAGGRYIPHVSSRGDAGLRPFCPAPEVAATSARKAAELDLLTPRQREVLGALADGSSNKEIARQMHVSEATVKIHVREIMRKLAVSNRVQAAIWARDMALDGSRDTPDLPARPSAGPVVATGAALIRSRE
ncbi:MAG: response regulator transcription factor [Rhodosalinus sp.]